MSTWPSGDVPHTNLDSGTDSPASARADIDTMVTRVNDMMNAKGQINGVAGLDGSGDVPDAQIPSTITRNTDLAFRGALVFDAANQSIPNTTITTLLFDTESYDTDAIHDTSTNTGRLTVPTGATKVRLTARVEFAIDGTGIRKVIFYKNGSTAFAGGGQNREVPISSDPTTMLDVTPVLTVTATDYFEVRVSQTSGSALDVLSTSQGQQSWFAMEVIE